MRPNIEVMCIVKFQYATSAMCATSAARIKWGLGALAYKPYILSLI